MWRRFRSKSLAPRRPVLFTEQWPLALLSAAALVVGIAAVVIVLVSR
jgi:hypothetical protein